ncbi:MAG: DUF3572 domain-containing protein [Hyphomicrobium sp.]|jgi:hypothetical protein|nr:DUF3572 domain-containing protein [Hyphomicrobium sp.]
MAKAKHLTIDDAKTLALQGLSFLASDAERLSRFLTLTGIDPSALRGWDADPGLQGAVLEHLLADESLLLVFAAEIGVPPEQIAPAYQRLSGTCGATFD